MSLDVWRVEITHNKITKLDMEKLYFCGFPTLKHIEHKVKRILTFFFYHIIIPWKTINVLIAFLSPP